MKRTILIAVCLSLIATAIFAQTPTVSVYFDDYYNLMEGYCPPGPVGSVLDTVYVVAEGFNMWMSAIEYAIDYPSPSLFVWIGDDVPEFGLCLGDSPSGITIAFTIPANAFDRLIVQEVYILWMCDDCGDEDPAYLRPVVHPGSGHIRAVRWPDEVLVPAVGLWSIVCRDFSPTEETSWGRIKALYK